MKKLFSFFLTLLFATSMFAVENAEIVASADIQRWGGQGDMYFDINAKDQNGQIWNLSLDPSAPLPSDGLYPWGTIMTEADMDWGYTELKLGYTMPTGSVTNLKFCAKFDGGVQMYELAYDATYDGVEYHVHAVHNVPEGTSLLEEPKLVADFDVEATGWTDRTEPGDVWFDIAGKDASGSWTFQFDPKDSKLSSPWTWGETYTKDDFDYGYAKVTCPAAGAKGTAKEIISFVMTLDGGKIAYLDAWILSASDKIINLHYGEKPAEKEDGDIELVSSNMKDATADGTDVYIDEFTAKDTKGRTWSFCFDPKDDSAEEHYPWGTMMTLADMDPNMKYTYVKLDGQALTLDSLKLFMDLSDDNGKPYLDATVWGKLGEQAYKVHVTANMPAPTTEITATSMTESLLYNGRAELEFKDAAGNSVTIDFKEGLIYYDQVYTYTNKQDSIIAIMTKYNGNTEAMNSSAQYDCWANFLVTKGESNNITVTLRYKTNRDNKYKLTYTGAYSGSRIVMPVVVPDTIAMSIETEMAEWVDDSRETGAWKVNYASATADATISGMLAFVDYSDNFVRSYSSEEMTMLLPYVELYSEKYPEGTELNVFETQDITLTTNTAVDTVLLTGTLLATNEDSVIYKFALHIAGAYPKVAGKEYDNEEADFDGTEVGTFYISDINYDAFWESTTYTAYTSDSAYMAKIVINDGGGTTPGGFDPLAVSEGVHPVSDDVSAPGVCVGGAYYTNPMGTNMDGSVIAKLDADGNVETPLWLFTEGLVLVQGEGENLIIMVNAANSYGKFISADLMMPKSPTTAIETVKNNEKTSKLLRNGALIIRKGEAEYNMLGATLK